jgi:hypothetical protein
MAINIPTCSIARPFKIFPNWDFWFENIVAIWQPCRKTTNTELDKNNFNALSYLNLFLANAFISLFQYTNNAY